jgi:hypothetical protein
MAENLVGKVLNLFSGDSNENLSDKEIVLRQRIKDLGENKYAKFYRMKTEEVDSSLGQFFYSIYKMILPIRTFMKDTVKTAKLRQIVLEAFLDPSIVEIVKRISPAEIEERSKNTKPRELAAQIRADIDALKAKFDSGRIDKINRCYNLVMNVFYLAMFDYPSLIKQFDANFTEGPFGGDAKFSPAKASSLAKNIADFLTISHDINPDNDWKTLLKLLRLCAGEELIPDNQFAQMLIGLRDVLNSHVLELLVQCGSKNPIWQCKPKVSDEHIAEAWLDARINKAQGSINEINDAEKHKHINVLLKDIFYGGDLAQLDFYTVARSDALRKKDLTHFVYAEGLNYLAVFLSEYVEKDIKELCDVLLIRGQWTNIAISMEVSEALHQLQELPEAITRLENALSDEGADGSRLKAALIRVDRDHSQARYINSIVDSINDNALEIINNAVQDFSVFDKHLKMLVDDVQKKRPEMIINWKELNSVSKQPMLQLMAENQSRINCFIQLMQLCIQ